MPKHIFPFLPILAIGAVLVGCSSDADEPVLPGFKDVPDGMTALRINPVAQTQGRGSSSVATTANLKDFDFVLNVEGSAPMKGRYDVATGMLYSTSSGVLSSSPIYVPTGSAFTLTAVAAGHTSGQQFVTTGGMLDYSPLATGSTSLSSSPTVLDYIQGTTARVVAAGKVMTVPLVLNHLTSQITLSAQVKGDYIIRLDRRLVWTGNVRSWNIDNTTAHITPDTSDKTRTRKFLLSAGTGPTNITGTPMASFAGTYSTMLLTESSGRVPLNTTAWDVPIKTWASDMEPSNAIFVWPADYTPMSAPYVSNGTFSGGAGLILNFQARACTKDAAGQLSEWGNDIIPSLPTSSNSLGDTDGTSIGSCSVFLPLDLTGTNALAAGRCYNLNIIFGAGSWGFDPEGNPSNFPISFTCEKGDWRLPPGIDASITGDGWSGNSMPNDNLR